MKTLHYCLAKGNNRRVHIWLLEDELGEKVFSVVTKRLISRKDREIIQTHKTYSVETFVIMKELFSYFLAEKKIDKLIKKQVSEIDYYEVYTTLNKKPKN